MTAMINNKVMGTPEDHVAGLAYSMLSYSPHDSLHTWIMDTGDSNHMCYDMNLIFNLKKTPTSFSSYVAYSSVNNSQLHWFCLSYINIYLASCVINTNFSLHVVHWQTYRRFYTCYRI